MPSSYLKNDLNTESKLRKYLDTIESFRKNKQLSNVSRRYNPRSETDNSSSNEEEEEEEDSDDYSDLWVNTNHIGEDVSDEDVSDEDVGDEDVSDEDVSDEDVSDEDVGDEDVSDEDVIAREEADRALLDYELYFWETDEFKKWLIEHNRLLKHYISEGSLYNAIDSAADPREFEDIDIWEDLLDENFMANLDLDYSENHFIRLYLRYRDDRRITRSGYNESGEKKLLFIHMYLKEAFFARYALRNIDFRKKLCLLGDVSRLEALYFESDKESYIKIPKFYKEVDSDDEDSDGDDYSMFDTPQNPELLRKELNIATGYDQILQEVMEMILLAHARNISTPLTTTEFASQLLTLNSDHLKRIHKKLQTILIDE
jgi:hypothetical protein